MWFNQPVTVLLEGQRTQEAGLGSYIYGIPGAGMYEPLIVAGRWLRPEDENRHVVVMNRETAEDDDVRVGDVVTLDLGLLGKDDWHVIGLYQVIFSGGFTFDAIYGPQEAVFRATKKYNQFRAILVWLGIVLVVSTLASIVPARNATVISVRESLAYE